MVYSIRKAAPTDTDGDRSARYGAYLAMALVVFGLGLSAYADHTTPAPVPPDNGPDVPPNPGPGPEPVPPPTPTSFASQVQAAFKADGGKRTDALMLGALAEQMGEVIPQYRDLFKQTGDIGAIWERVRGAKFQEVKTWAPKLHAAIDTEANNRGLKVDAVLNGNRAQFAKFYDELGKALLSYE